MATRLCDSVMVRMRLMESLSLVFPTGKEEQPVCHESAQLCKGLIAGKNAVTRRLSDTASCRRALVWAFRHAACCGIGALGVFTMPSLGSQGAQPGYPPTPTVAVQDVSPSLPDLSPPAPQECLRAFHAVRGVLLEGSGAALPAVNAGAASVIVRLDGKIIARGTATGSDALSACVQAANAEIVRGLDRAGDAAARAALKAELRRGVVSLELAGALVPFSPETFAQADRMMSPGMEGVGVRLGNGEDARTELMFPGTALLSGKLPGDALAACIAALLDDATAPIRGLPTGEPGSLASTKGLTYYKFRVAQVAQSVGDEQPRFLHRGWGIVPQTQISAWSMEELARGLAENLSGRMVMKDGVGGFGGTHFPVTGRTEPEWAGPREQALAALALAEYAAAEPDGSLAAPARSVAAQVLRGLAHEHGGMIPTWEDAAACGAWMLAARTLLAAEPRADLGPMERIALIDGVLEASYNEELGNEKSGWTVPAEGRGLIAYALAARAMDAAPEQRPEAIRHAASAVRGLFRDTPAPRLVVHMPWLGRAEQMLAEGGEIPAASSLREFRRTVWEHQVVNVEGDNADLAGGIVFTASGNPYPTWQSATAVCFPAMMLGDSRLTDAEEVLPEVGRVVKAVRFIRQMSLGREGVYAAASPRKALWGVRIAPWDPRQPIEATSTALLAVMEARRGIARAEARLAEVQGKP